MIEVTAETLVDDVDRALPGAPAVRRLEVAAAEAARLAGVADAAVSHFVEAARAEGASWADIGAALRSAATATRSDADLRPGSPGSGSPSTGSPGAEVALGSDDLDEEGREVLARAFAAARALRHQFVGSEHLLLGLVDRPGSRVADLLAAAGVTAGAARREVVAVVGEGESLPEGEPGLTARGQKVLEIARREAGRLGDQRVGPAHLLLGLIDEGRGVASIVLATLVGDVARLREAVVTGVDHPGSLSGDPSLT